MAGKASGWAAWRAKTGGRDPIAFKPSAGRESKISGGSQPMRAHPMASRLGGNLSGGMKRGKC